MAADAPACVADYASGDNIISKVDPVLLDRKYNSIPVRIVIDKNNTQRILVAGALTVLGSVSVGAQGVTVDQRWQPWIGCWQPPSFETTASESPRVCVVPATGSAGVIPALRAP